MAITDDRGSLDLLEIYYIEKFNATINPEFYNLAKGGTGGDTLSSLTDQQLSERSQKIKNYFQSLNDEEKKLLSDTRSKNIKKARENKKLEKQRIQNFKTTYKAKSLEQKEEHYKHISGGNNYGAIKVKTPCGCFDCASDAAKIYNINVQTVLNRCRNSNFKEWEILA